MADADRSIGIIGGTGPAGRGVAIRLAAGGEHVVLGSRDLEKAKAAVDKLHASAGDVLAADGTGSITAGSNADAAGCALVILAANANHVVASAEEHAEALAGSIVVSMAAAVTRDDRGFRPNQPKGGSLAEAVAEALPTSMVVSTLHHMPAAALADVSTSPSADVLVCGDDSDAVQLVIARLSPLTDGRIFDAGSLANSASLESLTAVLLTLNRNHGRSHSISFVEAL